LLKQAENASRGIMTFGSLFAGIGGIDLGLERTGMECRWQVEIDPFCREVLRKHWPNVKRYEDVREVGEHNLEPVDLLCGVVRKADHGL
jgi:DNA (cytosine-5)-methyltransferase 1